MHREFKGVVTKDYVNNRAGTENIQVYEFYEKHLNDTGFSCVENLIKLAKIVQQQKAKSGVNVEIDENFINDAIKIAFANYLTLQIDNFQRNLEFIIEDVDNKKVLKLSPFFKRTKY